MDWFPKKNREKIRKNGNKFNFKLFATPQLQTTVLNSSFSIITALLVIEYETFLTEQFCHFDVFTRWKPITFGFLFLLPFFNLSFYSLTVYPSSDFVQRLRLNYSKFITLCHLVKILFSHSSLGLSNLLMYYLQPFSFSDNKRNSKSKRF